uniref:Methyltransferase domain-containing protein n=1 Tax=Ciona savignyi TaxID=51511 RepID=H2YX11_CIOSA
MSNQQLEEKCLENIKRVVWCKTAEESQNHYKVWSEQYDTELAIIGGSGSQAATNMFSKHVKDKINSVVLDLGGGTGTSSLFIRNQLQFQGELDILDANIEMLYKASQKKNWMFGILFDTLLENLGNSPFVTNPMTSLFLLGLLFQTTFRRQPFKE